MNLTSYSRRSKNIVFLFILIFSSCSPVNDSYFPLQSGFSWQYGIVATTMNGTEEYKQIFENLPVKEINEERVTFRKTLTGSQIAYQEDKDGIYQIGYMANNAEDLSFFPERKYEIKKPIQIGTSWSDVLTTTALRSGGPRGVVLEESIPVLSRIVSTKDDVQVMAGLFRNCLQIESEGEVFLPEGKYQYIRSTMVRIKERRWYARGVGLIRIERQESTDAKNLNRGEQITELEKYGT